MIGLEAVKMDFSDCYQYFPQTTTCSSPSESPVLDQEAPLLTCLSSVHVSLALPGAAPALELHLLDRELVVVRQLLPGQYFP